MARTADVVRVELAAKRGEWQRYNKGMNENGEGYNPHSQALQALESEYDALREAEVAARFQARIAAEDAEWTVEVTRQRRAAWNAWIRSQGHTIHPATVAAHCRDIGWDMQLLSRQIKRHGL